MGNNLEGERGKGRPKKICIGRSRLDNENTK